MNDSATKLREFAAFQIMEAEHRIVKFPIGDRSSAMNAEINRLMRSAFIADEEADFLEGVTPIDSAGQTRPKLGEFWKTRDGRIGEIIRTDNSFKPILVLIEGSTSWHIPNGRFCLANPDPRDLMERNHDTN